MKQRMLPLLILLLVTVATPSWAYRSLHTSRSYQSPAKTEVTTPISIPFELAYRHIMLKVSINNSRPLSFVLDTGDKYAIVSLDRAKELGLNLHGQVRVGGAGAQTSVGAFVRDSTFTIPGLPGFSQPVKLALPIGALSSRMGHDFDGILGSDFISEFVVEIDYQQKLIKLHDKTRFTYAGPGESIPIKLNSQGHPTLEAEVTPIGGQAIKGRFVLDIGSAGALVLHSPFVNARQLLSPDLKTIRVIGGAGAGGEISGRLGRVAELKIGNFTLSKPITLFSQDKAGAFANAELLGNIGAQVANRFRVFLDYSRDRIIFEPNSTLGTPYDRAFSGITLQAEGKKYEILRVTGVLEDSPATEVGLQQNDIITAVDGKAAAELGLTKLNNMLEQPVPYKLTIQRGEQTLTISLTPRRLI